MCCHHLFASAAADYHMSGGDAPATPGYQAHVMAGSHLGQVFVVDTVLFAV